MTGGDTDQNYDLIKLFFREKCLVRQHIDSFNHFIEHDIRQIMEANNIVDSDIDHTFYLKYLDIRVGSPTITENMMENTVYPLECRNRDLTYAANIYVDVEYVKNKQIVVKRDLLMGKIPVMLRSARCHLAAPARALIESSATQRRRVRESKDCQIDNGGYFIIKGIERVIMIQEQLSKNRIILETGPKGLYAGVTSSSIHHKGKTNVVLRNECFFVQNTIFTEEVPALVVARAMGIGDDQSICEVVGRELFDVLSPSFEELAAGKVFREDQAILYLAKYVKMGPDADRMAEVRALLAEKVFPNIGVGLSLRNKGVYLCLMIRRLAQAKLGVLAPDDKDFLGNKRFELAGQLLSILFEDTFKKFNFELKKSIDKILSKRTRTSEFDALTFFNLQTSGVTASLNRAISSGVWNLKRFRMERSGVTSIVTRYSYICALGMMTKINSHFEKTRKVSGPRALHTSSWGMFCPADTPEGESCGLVKNLALLTEITTDCDPARIEEVLAGYGVRRIDECHGKEFYQGSAHLVYINGAIFGLSTQPATLVRLFRAERRRGGFSCFVSIFTNAKERSIFISTDNGRMCRPLIIVDQKRVREYFAAEGGRRGAGSCDNFSGQRDFARERDMLAQLGILLTREQIRYKTFTDLIREGKIEYLDAQEENDCRLAFLPGDITAETTHLELSEFTILGYVAGLVPFPHHNQSPRNTYQCAMGKQGIGHIATNVKKRFDSMILQLNYTQRPMAASKTLDIVKYNRIPTGLNAMVAVMSYSGYDIEDALILNRGSIDRGLARVEVYKTSIVPIKKYPGGQSEQLVPGPGGDGIVSPGATLEEGSVTVSKMSPATNTVTNARHHGLPARVDKVMITKNESESIIKIVTRETRVPEIGDKFSSRHGQKGVVGLVVPQVDMPFNEHGLNPDIIMNPHGFPSRMTVGKMLELISGKAALVEGGYADATAFKNNEVRAVCDTLSRNGFSYSGKDVFTSGTTGEPFEAYVFYGPIFYQRLKHMVADKMHCRARGPRAILTRQPTEGRSRDGGLRLGEMERDCLIGYGAASLLNERLMISSDVFEAHVCKDCGIISYKNCCVLCKRNNPVVVKMPYACKLLFQELMCMNILPKIELR
ncbi:DNA-directed RNA polymerase III subunit RPC2 [Pancytospora philotis]|nr:DNA-directed RNA polymerase III subunit RPC2 [Pancytospora philotis]